MLDEIQVETQCIQFYCSLFINNGNGILKLVCFQGCTILSGDVIISHLAAYSKPIYVVFLVSFIYQICPFLFLNFYKNKALSEHSKLFGLLFSIEYTAPFLYSSDE